MLQLRTQRYEEVIEWIPFDRLYNVEEIGKREDCSVYSTILLNGLAILLAKPNFLTGQGQWLAKAIGQ
ncbi:hypothetical protein F8M41_010485 [Gigaspora margarita]|uniref:Uncharacterized protein n=1 Tax=Gigaspora margarita TaxID=4874 RepID=A0A8H4A0Z9_GIGMA|nr:hypothetical protein F8M41_010485 [Gigaspora margarita]